MTKKFAWSWDDYRRECAKDEARERRAAEKQEPVAVAGIRDSGQGAASSPGKARCEGEAPEGTSGAATACDGIPANASQARPLSTRPPVAPSLERQVDVLDAPPARGKIDLSAAPSAMEQAAERWRTTSAAGQDARECGEAEAEGLIFCKCGARRPGAQGGKVPAFFPDNCIEGECPWRGVKK